MMAARRRWRKPLSVLGTAMLLPALTGAPAVADEGSTIGSDGFIHVSPHGEVLGADSFYPKDGNGGYNVARYDVNLKVHDFTRSITATNTIIATATQDLTQFNLDLQGLEVTGVEVNNATATFRREGEHELVIIPAERLAKGDEFTVHIAYRGIPRSTETNGRTSGWQWHKRGVLAAGMPHGARTWMPINDTSADKAKLIFSADVPRGWSMVGNGAHHHTNDIGFRKRVTWVEDTEVAPSGMVLALGPMAVTTDKLADGKPLVNAYSPNSQANRKLAERIPEVINFLSQYYGDYTRSSAGALFLPSATDHSYGTQGHPVLGAEADMNELVYATATQWWGNQASIKTWADYPLMQAFSRYSVWLWDEAKNGANLDERYKSLVEANSAKPDFWSPKLRSVGAGNEFAADAKGELFAHALRKKLGEKKFKNFMRQFCMGSAYWSNVAWSDFTLFVQAVGGSVKMDSFWAAWLDGTVIPPKSELYPGA